MYLYNVLPRIFCELYNNVNITFATLLFNAALFFPLSDTGLTVVLYNIKKKLRVIKIIAIKPIYSPPPPINLIDIIFTSTRYIHEIRLKVFQKNNNTQLSNETK